MFFQLLRPYVTPTGTPSQPHTHIGLIRTGEDWDGPGLGEVVKPFLIFYFTPPDIYTGTEDNDTSTYLFIKRNLNSIHFCDT